MKGQKKNPKRVAAGRIGGLVRSSRYSPDELTKAAHAGFKAKFEREVDPELTLSDEERQRRAGARKKAYMADLARRSAAVRAANKPPPANKPVAPPSRFEFVDWGRVFR